MLFVIDVAKRTIHIAGMTAHPNDAWMMQVARKFTEGLTGTLVRENQTSRSCHRWDQSHAYVSCVHAEKIR